MTEDRRTLVIDGDLTKALAELRKLDAHVDKSAAGASKIAGNLGRADVEAKKLAAANKGIALQLRGQADAIKHQADLLKIAGKDQSRVVQLQQQSLALRQQAAKAVGQEAQAVKLLRQQELLAARERKRVESDQLKASAARQQALTGAASRFGPAGAVAGLSGPLIAVTAAAAVTAGAVRLVGDETKRLDDIAKQAQVSGLGTDAYQRLSHLAELAGTDVETLGKSTLRLNVGLREVADGGGKKMAAALADIGLSAKDLEGLSDTDRLAKIADGFGRIESESTKSALAFEIFGRTGTDLIPLLNAGGAELKAMAGSIGRVFTREELAKAEKYRDAMTELEKSSGDLKAELVIALAPAIQRVSEFLTQSTRGWSTAFRDPERAVRQLGNAFIKIGESVGRSIKGITVYGKSVGDATEWVKEHVTAAQMLSDRWDAWRGSIVSTDKALGSVTSRHKAALAGLLATGKEISQTEEQRVEFLNREAGLSEHMVRLGEAQKRPAKDLEVLYRQQHLARVDLYKATGDLAALEKEMRNEEIRKAASRSRRGGGGQRSSEAENLRAEGNAIIKGWQDQLAIMEAEAALIFEGAVEFADQRHAIAVEQLRLEQQTLDLTKGKTVAERTAIEARKEAIDREIQILDLQHKRAEQAKAIEDEKEAMALRLADIDRQIEKNEALGVSVRLLQETRNEVALQYAELLDGEEGRRQELHDQEIARINARTEAQKAAEEQRKAWHEAEIKRLDEQRKRQQQTTQAIGGFLGQGQQIADMITAHAIKNDAKRERAALRVQGVMAMAKGAMEVVNAAVSAAALNVPQAILHGVAAGIAFTQGGLMIAGVVPGGGGSAGAGISGGSARHEVQVNQEPPARERPGVPVSAEAMARMRNGGDVAANDSGGGGNVTNINAGIIVTNDSSHMLGNVANSNQRKWG